MMIGASVSKGANTTSKALRQPCINVVLTRYAINGPGMVAALAPKTHGGQYELLQHLHADPIRVRS